MYTDCPRGIAPKRSGQARYFDGWLSRAHGINLMFDRPPVGILKLSSNFKVYLIKLCFDFVLNFAAFPAPVAKYINDFRKPQNLDE